MVGREVLLRVDKTPATPGEHASRGRRPARARRPRARAGPRGLVRRSTPARSSAIAGVDGNGQTQLIEALTGLRGRTSGRVEIAGRTSPGLAPPSSSTSGVGHIPEDRQRRGLVLDFSLAENFALHDFDRPPNSRFGWLDPAAPRAGGQAGQGVRRQRRRPADARRVTLRREPAEGRRRARGRR